MIADQKLFIKTAILYTENRQEVCAMPGVMCYAPFGGTI